MSTDIYDCGNALALALQARACVRWERLEVDGRSTVADARRDNERRERERERERERVRETPRKGMRGRKSS